MRIARYRGLKIGWIEVDIGVEYRLRINLAIIAFKDLEYLKEFQQITCYRLEAAWKVLYLIAGLVCQGFEKSLNPPCVLLCSSDYCSCG